jgi:hypothetical protein
LVQSGEGRDFNEGGGKGEKWRECILFKYMFGSKEGRGGKGEVF